MGLFLRDKHFVAIPILKFKIVFIMAVLRNIFYTKILADTISAMDNIIPLCDT